MWTCKNTHYYILPEGKKLVILYLSIFVFKNFFFIGIKISSHLPYELVTVGAKRRLPQERRHELVTVDLMHAPSHRTPSPVETLTFLELPTWLLSSTGGDAAGDPTASDALAIAALTTTRLLICNKLLLKNY